MQTTQKFIKRRSLSILLVLLLVLTLGSVWYVSDYYHADPYVDTLLYSPSREIDFPNVEICLEQDLSHHIYSLTSNIPENEHIGLIFYPGGKVEYTAYLPLLMQCAVSGIDCYLIHMPCNLAVLSPGAAEDVIDAHPEITTWIMAGHSLGGSMAADYTAKHPDQIDALALLASYSTSDLSSLDIPVVSLYGTEDQVLNRNSYEKYRSHLPSDYEEIVIPGGCHAYFGYYGAQKGDGIPTINQQDQIDLTVEAILSLIEK